MQLRSTWGTQGKHFNSSGTENHRASQLWEGLNSFQRGTSREITFEIMAGERIKGVQTERMKGGEGQAPTRDRTAGDGPHA